MTHEDYVTFEQAKALKELGFDWEVSQYYWVKKGGVIEMASIHPSDRVNPNINGWGRDNKFSAPTLYQAQKWLREVKGISVEPVSCGYEINGNIDWSSFICLLKDKLGYDQTATLSSYEQALSAGIDKALELLKEESK